MIDKKEVEHIAKLARLELTKEEKEKFQKDFSAILDYFNLLKKIDVSNIEPTFHPTEEFLKDKDSITRQDEAEKKAEKKPSKLLESAPDREKGWIKVKSVFGGRRSEHESI